MSPRRSVILIAATALALAACSSDADTDGTTAGADTSTADTTVDVSEVVAGEAFPADRCEANKAAGPIVYLSSFDFSASASIVEVLVAESKGYYDDLCLDVQLTPSFSVDNYPLIAANEAQFSSGGSFSEMVDFADANDAGFVALAVDGRTGIDALITKDGEVPDLARPPASRSSCTTRATTTSPAASASSTRTARSSASSPRPPRTSCGRR